MNMIDWFDKKRYWGKNRTSRFLQKCGFYGVSNRLLDTVANVVLPRYFRATQNDETNRLKLGSERSGSSPRVIISLTSFPKRIPTLWLVIESLLRQTVKPDAIILHLTQSQVPSLDMLPAELLAQQERGLQIRLCPDPIRSHTKYYYAFKEHPEDIVITVDDDLFYRSTLVEDMLKHHEQYPEAIIANWVKEILPGKEKYAEWPDGSTPKLSPNHFLLGVRGVLYPPHCMYEDIFDTENIIKLCLTADDVWLSCMALLKGTPMYFTATEYNHLPVNIKNNETLISTNISQNQVQVDNLNAYYQKKLGIRPFIDLIK